MDTTQKIISYGIGKYIFIPLLIAGCAAAWAFLKELPDKTEKRRQENIKEQYRKELAEKELVEKLKREVREEMKQQNK